jgi:hypothetical protein
VINGVVSLWKTDNMDQGSIIYVWGSLEDRDHNSKYLTGGAGEAGLQERGEREGVGYRAKGKEAGGYGMRGQGFLSGGEAQKGEREEKG